MGKSTISMVIFSNYVKLPEGKLKPLSTHMEPKYGTMEPTCSEHHLPDHVFFGGSCKFAGDFMFQALADSSNVSLLIHYIL